MLDWDGPEDELNPFNWSSTARWVGTLMPGIFCFVVTLSSSIVSVLCSLVLSIILTLERLVRRYVLKSRTLAVFDFVRLIFASCSWRV